MRSEAARSHPRVLASAPAYDPARPAASDLLEALRRRDQGILGGLCRAFLELTRDVAEPLAVTSDLGPTKPLRRIAEDLRFLAVCLGGAVAPSGDHRAGRPRATDARAEVLAARVTRVAEDLETAVVEFEAGHGASDAE